ncbi:hypothetical protein HPB48_020300 [Haemaphysalis longicornis]|uniref:Uncharacterized protein n=1 Tax=Haemaphysalis longicornis TaxID=44386 RepID=A0A9J6GYS7_HAELO|nr:hypothetical protein HPB48_020300 [Haemaphysalis longicornis]
MVITFCGKRVSYYINYSGIPVPCYLYKITVPYCHKCHKTAHREDVCPQPPKTPRFGKCGLSLTDTHECHPQCILCGEPTRRRTSLAPNATCHLLVVESLSCISSSPPDRSALPPLNSVVVVRASANLAHKRGAMPVREGASRSIIPDLR